VLDTTGSMADNPDNTNCYPCTTSKIEGLKSAIRSFYTTLAQSVPAGGDTRVRFGFVPYSGTVNISGLVDGGDIPSTYLTASTSYQAKLANFTTPIYTVSSTSTDSQDVTSSQSSNSKCNTWGNAANKTGGGPPPAATTVTTYTRLSYDSRTDVCTRRETTTTTTYVISAYGFTDYTYVEQPLDTSRLRSRTAVNYVTAIASNATVPVRDQYDMISLAGVSGSTGLTTSSLKWSGCVEERSTVSTVINPAAIPAEAYDLDVDSAPSSDLTRWHPYIAELEVDRGRTSPHTTTTVYGASDAYCPASSKKFTTVDTSAPNTVPGWIETYLATLYPRGGTYHDIGMIWGARLASPQGILATNVNDGNLTSLSRHLIFLTDGAMAPNHNVYTAYGLEYLDNRVAPYNNTSDWQVYQTYLKTYHNARFLAACRRATEAGYTVWIVGFGQDITPEMETCAPGRTMRANDTADLQSQFRDIASRIADLRLKS